MPPPPRRSATIKDVAELAGVSVSTVSHAFSGARPISEETKERIFTASRVLGYVPNAHARKLRLGRSGMLGLSLRPSFDFVRTPDDAETFNRLAGSMAIHCLHRGIGLVHVPDVVGRGHDMVPMDGCIVAHPQENDPAIRYLETAGVPLVLIDPDPGRASTPWTVRLDYAAGVRHVLDLVSDAGRRRVVLIREQVRNAWNIDSADAYSRWCEDNGRRPRIYQVDEHVRGPELDALLNDILANEEPKIGVVFMASDTTSTMLQAIERRGWAVPRDVSVAALTDTAHSRTSTPALTAMDLAHEDVAAAAVDLLLDRIAGEPAPQEPVVIVPRVNERASTRQS